jgi:hypothetical protein
MVMLLPRRVLPAVARVSRNRHAAVERGRVVRLLNGREAAGLALQK